MAMSELKGKSADQLNQMVLERRKEMFNLRFQRATGELTNTSRFRVVRREIASIKTYMNQQKKSA